MEEIGQSDVNLQQIENFNFKGMNFIQRFIGVFVSPSETMENLVVKPRILLPFLMIALAKTIINLLRYPLYEESVRIKLEKLEELYAANNIKLPVQELSAVAKKGLLTDPLAMLLLWVVISAIVFWIMKIFKGQGKYKQYLSVSGHTYLIAVLALIVSCIASFFTGSLVLDTSLAAFFPKLKGEYLYGIFKGIDLFMIWMIIVAGIGVNKISKVSYTKIYSVFFGLYTVVVLISANTSKLM